MKQAIVNSGLKAANHVLRFAHMKLVRTWTKEHEFRDYIPLQETIESAKALGLSVGDYVDAKNNVPGATQQTIDEMAELGVFAQTIETVCEIGPGTGRYLEKVMQLCQPKHYEIYEISDDWSQWLVETYNVTAHRADGRSLANTPSSSIDLVHAHKVFTGVPVLIIAEYLYEMARVVRGGGKIVFDVLTEHCLDPAMLRTWLDSGITYPCSMVARQVVIDLFAGQQCRFVGSFMEPMKPGRTEVMVFTK